MCKITIYNDDCNSKLKELIKEGCKVDAIICDTPYIIDYAEWDKSFDLESILPLCKEILKENGNIILFQGWSKITETKLLMDKYFQIQNWVIWNRKRRKVF